METSMPSTLTRAAQLVQDAMEFGTITEPSYVSATPSMICIQLRDPRQVEKWAEAVGMETTTVPIDGGDIHVSFTWTDCVASDVPHTWYQVWCIYRPS